MSGTAVGRGVGELVGVFFCTSVVAAAFARSRSSNVVVKLVVARLCRAAAAVLQRTFIVRINRSFIESIHSQYLQAQEGPMFCFVKRKLP